MAADPTLSIEHLAPWLGKEEVVSDIITPTLVDRFTATLAGIGPPHVPLGLHWCTALNVAATQALGADGHPATGDFLPPVPLPRRMWASSQIDFHRALLPNETVSRHSQVANIQLKHNAQGSPLVFVDVQHTFTQSGHACVEETQTLVYREAASKPVPADRPTTNETADTQTKENREESFVITPSRALLFRYSALTFNAHRIHYDQQYASEVEHYRGLVVQGPLMATLLMNVAASARTDAALSSFQFKGVAPAFVDEALRLVIRDESAETLEITAPDNRLIMQASATFR